LWSAGHDDNFITFDRLATDEVGAGTNNVALGKEVLNVDKVDAEKAS
jgi:hypothetical protein